jgi:hypothetical protein
MKKKLLSVLSDPATPQGHKDFASRVLQKYGEIVESYDDIEVGTMLAEWGSYYLWFGLRTIKKVEGVETETQDENPDAPGFGRAVEFHREYPCPLISS